MFDLLWDIYQQRQISDAHDKADDAGRKATDFQYRVRALEDQIDRMALVNLAMWQLLRDQAGVTDEQLAAKVHEIDLADGKADGRISRSPNVCSKCRRTLSARHQRCLYCGQAVSSGGTPFRGYDPTLNR